MRLSPCVLLAAAPCFFFHDWRNTRPSKSLSATDVVALQLSALSENEAPGDLGLARTFDFASERNKEVTGPLERFKEMIRRGGAFRLALQRGIELK